MSYKIEEFNVNDVSAVLSGVDIINNSGSDKPASVKSVESLYGKVYDYDDYDYVHVMVDSNDKLISTINKQGEVRFSVIPPQIQEAKEELTEDIDALRENIEAQLENYPDFISHNIEDTVYVIVDSDGKQLFTIDREGNVNWSCGVPEPIKEYVSSYIIENFFIKENSEYVYVMMDPNEKMIESIAQDGTRTHYVDNVFTGKVKFTDDTMNQFEQDLKNHGFTAGTGDWSDNASLKLKTPWCAMMNITGTTYLPTTKTMDMKVTINFYDMQGNFFKKKAIINAQGRSTMSHPKKNISMDICNDDWIGDDTFKVQFGDWVPQDSFHLKAYYNDPFRGMCVVSYKLMDKVLKSRGLLNDYVWKRAQLDLDSITTTSNGCTEASDTQDQYSTGARCFPDGFPCIVYLNGEFYGIYSWQLKKHRDNYNQSKKNAKHIHLDGIISNSTLFEANGDVTKINWIPNGSPEGFEIRNPKDIVLMDGSEYDADNNPGELIDETSEFYDSTNEDHVKSAEVKSYILAHSCYKSTIQTAADVYESSEKTEEDLQTFRNVFETYYDPENLMDYMMTSDLIRNYDGFGQNWQWVTYDGVKWYVCMYDCDGTFGNYWKLENTILAPNTTHQNTGMMLKFVKEYYWEEMKARYAELREFKIFDHRNIMDMIQEWLDRIGNRETFEQEWERWPDFIKNDSILRVEKWLEQSIENMDALYEYTK